MRNSLLIVAAVICLGYTTSAAGQQTCTAIQPSSLKGQRPLEVNTSTGPGTCGFMQFSWQDFLALSWPPLPIDPNNTTSQARGVPDGSQLPGQSGDNPTVWEQDQPNWYLFQPNNPPPVAVNGNSYGAWNQYATLPSACGPQKTPPPRILSSLSKFDAMPGVSQAFSAPIIDQNGYYARYEIVLDYPAFNYVNSNQFYLLSSVTNFASNNPGGFSFPVQSGNIPGATFIKASWKTLSAAEINSGRFHTAQAFLFTPAASGLNPTCAGPVTVGLVGLHIVHKTTDFGNYIWETFEQVDNTPADPSNPGPTPPQGWSFYNPSSSTTPNTMPNCPNGNPISSSCDFQPTSSHLNDKTGGPTQIVRLNPIPKSPNQQALSQINSAMQSALKAINPNSVWQYYELVDAQWQTTSPPQTCANATSFFPTGSAPSGFVANATMETYHQAGSSGSSCMTCHKGATSPFGGQTKVCSDLTFELTLAWQQTQLPASRVPGLAAANGKDGKKVKK